MKWVRWLMIAVSVFFAITALACFFVFSPVSRGFLGFVLFGCCAFASWPSTFFPAPLAHGKVYGVPYYLDFDGSRHYFRANVYGYQATAPHETAIKEVIFRRLTQAVARRAVDSVIKEM
jgi:hypothetical protein